METKGTGGIDFKRDLREITNFIQEYVDRTYLSQIHHQVHTYKRGYQEKPSKEAQLLRAMLPFVQEENKEKLSNLIQMITYSQMIETMLPQYSDSPLFSSGVRADHKEGKVAGSHYLYQAVLVVVLYQVILWAEQYKCK